MSEMKSLTINGKTYDSFVDAVARSLVETAMVIGSASGENIVVSDSNNYNVVGLRIFGKTTQDGTPTPDAPVELVSVGDSGSITANVTGNNNSQNMTVATPNGLPGIPVTSGGNYTDSNGQQWICDEIDLARGVYIKRVKYISLLNIVSEAQSTVGTGNVADGETVYIHTTNENIGELINNGMCLSEKLPCLPIFGNDIEAVNIEGPVANYSIRFRLKKSRLSNISVKGVIEYLTDNPIVVMYILATPIETPLSEEEIAAYSALRTYRNNTTVSNDASAHMELEYVMDAKKYIDRLIGTGGGGGSAARLSNVTLLASAWKGTASPYSQVVTIDGITEYSKVDLLPSVEQLAIFHNKDVAFVTENEDGVVTVYAIGEKPTNDYTMQVSITEVVA